VRLVYSRQHSARAGFGIRRTGMTPCVCGDRAGLTDTKGTNSILGKQERFVLSRILGEFIMEGSERMRVRFEAV